MAHWTIFNTTFRCGKRLKNLQHVSQILLELVCVTPWLLTINTTSQHNSARLSSMPAQDDVALKVVLCNIAEGVGVESQKFLRGRGLNIFHTAKYQKLPGTDLVDLQEEIKY